jgi:tRNA threonylcarbamoyladenosine biosynthesis protein TsaB
MLILALDTATEAATVAVVRDGEVLGERETTAGRVLVALEELLTEAAIAPREAERIVVGRGPGRYTSLRMGLVTARALAFSVGAELIGVSTLDALAAGADGAFPMIDARRREVFVLDGGPVCVRPEHLRIVPEGRYVGDGACRYRSLLEAAGATVPPEDDPAHTPWARHHALLVDSAGGPAEPIYLRAPDADQTIARTAG